MEKTIPGCDSLVRSAVIRVYTGGKKSKLFRRPVQLLYPVKISNRTELSSTETSMPENTQQVKDRTPEEESSGRPKRNAALQARDRV